MPFSNTWDAAFEAAPADNEDINLGANRIRALKVAIRERMQIDHEWEDAEQDGKHNKVTLVPQDAAPVPVTPDGALFTMVLAGHTELLYKDDLGNLMQLSQAGKLYPFAIGDFSVGEDLAVAVNATIGATLSVGAGYVNDFALFASTGTGNTTVQFGLNNWITFLRATNQIQIVCNGVVVQTFG